MINVNVAELQWGRCANAAESLQWKSALIAMIKLQWGRCANAAESRDGTADRGLHGALASMGPLRERSGEGGTRRQGRRACGGGFNGAAARTQRRGCSAIASALPNSRASMGPLRERSGEIPASDSPGAGRSGFNGAAARTQRREANRRLA